MRSVLRRWSVGGGERGACCLGGCAFVLSALLGCDFSDVVDIGRHDAGGAPSQGWAAPGGFSGMGGGPSLHPPPPDVCGVGVQTGMVWVDVSSSPGVLAPGSGGPLRFGVYGLRVLAKHGQGRCITTGTVAQTLAFRDGGHGSVISDYRAGGHFAAAFTFAASENRISITPTCADPLGPMSEVGSFGPFETYTATENSLVLVSEACGYTAAYEFLPIPTR